VTAIVTRGNAMDLHLPDETVDLIVTSPPYFGLRSYQDGGEHYEGQVGDEATPTEYLDALIACTAEWMRVLKPGGSIFVNLGDKYAQDQERSRNGNGNRVAIDGFTGGKPLRGRTETLGRKNNGVPRKSLIGLPWRYALRCIDELGLILRAEIVWAKPNGLPESVTDRVRRSHEQVFHFVKQPRYYSAVDEVREAHSEFRPGGVGNGGKTAGATESHRTRSDVKNAGIVGLRPPQNPLGKLPGSVWTIPTAPLKVPASLGIDHFAAYPPELVRRIVLGWSPREVCTACGEGRRPVVTTTHERPDGWPPGMGASTRMARRAPGSARPSFEGTITGYECAWFCKEDDPTTVPGIVLDPFGGTGTTALVASAYGRVGISVDLSADYCRLAQWRTTDPGERARVLKVEKPPVQVDGQLGMFEGLGA
jgi:DNA modification methylase